MIKVQIDMEIREYEKQNKNWITQKINDYRRAGESFCVRVKIEKGSLTLSLATQGCPPCANADWIPSKTQNEIISIWEHFGLHKEEFSAGSLIAFLNQIDKNYGG